jgi:GNAT superfamily N-acetyltransferase
MRSTVRPAALTDVPALTELVRAYWSFERIPDFDAPRVAGLLQSFLMDPKAGCCFVAALDTRAVGYLLASYVFSLEHGGTMAEIDEFFVVEDQRGNRTGTRLLDAAATAMKNAGLVRLQLQLGERNTSGRDFYLRHGFRRREGYRLWDRSLAADPSSAA